MIGTRARGLANLHGAATVLCTGVFFWVYANIIYHVPYVRLSHEVNLLPYFVCVLGGMILSVPDVARIESRFHLLDAEGALRLAARQVGRMALLTFTMMFATQDHRISRLFLGSFLVWSWLGLGYLNARLPGLLARLLFQNAHSLPTLLVGRIASLSRLDQWLRERRPLGIELIGLVSPDPAGTGAGAEAKAAAGTGGGASSGTGEGMGTGVGPGTGAGTGTGAGAGGGGAGHGAMGGGRGGCETHPLPVPRLGAMADLPRILEERGVWQVVMLELPATDEEAGFVIESCVTHGCRLLICSDVDGRYTHPLVPVTEGGRHYYTLHGEPLEDPLNRTVKRIYDIALSLPVVVFVLPPLCAWVALMQRIQSPAPLFHARERCGIRGRAFRMLKFRSMRTGPGGREEEARQADLNDPRIYPFGRFLRRRSVDEFPQFWNVLVGDMSIVGPRPYMPSLDEEFRRHSRGYRSRGIVKPGITGLAQSLGFRGAVLEEEMLQRRVTWDVHYITHWSLWMDIRITAQTLWQVVRPPKTAF